MESLYKTIMETTTICCLGIANFFTFYANYYCKNINYDLENSRKLVKEFRAEWDSSINNLNKNLTNLEANLDKLHKSISYLTGLVDGANITIH